MKISSKKYLLKDNFISKIGRSFFSNKSDKKLDNEWGREIKKHRNFDLISSYHELVTNKNSHQIVDKKTWSDLDLDEVFSKLDRNITGVGQQYLYHILHLYERNENVLKSRFQLIDLFRSNKELRVFVQGELRKIPVPKSYFISSVLFGNTLPDFRYYPILYLFSLLSISSLVLISLNGIFLFISIGILVTNLVLHNMLSKKVYNYFIGFSGLNSLINSAIFLGKFKGSKIPEEIYFLKDNLKLLASLKSKIGYLVIERDTLNELGRVVIDYLNFFMLFDLIAYFRSRKTLIKNKEKIIRVFHSIANLDMSISVASFLTENPSTTTPKFNYSNEVRFKNIWHPLIHNVVPNTFDKYHTSILITGSNMSGKTTFIKTVGVSALLAQTLYISLADDFTIPFCQVKTSIIRRDELMSGKSYFYIEIERIKEFLQLKEEDNYIFLIDEIFRGTNTLERLAISTAVLKYLSSNNTAFVTTHDVELQELLESYFSMYHFEEQVKDDTFYFDYLIKRGPCNSGNAIKLLDLMNYPSQITSTAKNILNEIVVTHAPSLLK